MPCAFRIISRRAREGNDEAGAVGGGIFDPETAAVVVDNFRGNGETQARTVGDTVAACAPEEGIKDALAFL